MIKELCVDTEFFCCLTVFEWFTVSVVQLTDTAVCKETVMKPAATVQLQQ